MWRFILISFAFLGFAFYEASGGSDYTPSPDSLQVAMADKPFFAPARSTRPASTPTEIAAEPDLDEPSRKTPVKVAKAEPEPTRAAEPEKKVTLAGLSGLSKDDTGGFELTLAAITQPLKGGNAMSKRESVKAEDASGLDAADIRSISGTNANMRSGPGTDFDKVDQLAFGTSVEVLDRRGAWVELRDMDTGQTGWMADWLVTAAN